MALKSRAEPLARAERGSRLTSELDVAQSLRDQASSLFRTAHDEGLCSGRSIEAIATGSVYAACRLTEVTRTLEEIVAVARVERNRITNAYGTLNRELALPTPPQEPVAFIPSIASAVDVTARTEHRARELASEATTAGVAAGRHPAGFAAACLEVAAEITGASVTQLALADAADVDPVTVRKHRETIRATLDG